MDAVRRRGDAAHEVPFHVPGHKRGSGAPHQFAQLVSPPHGSVLQYDLTEIAGLDYLTSPTGPIRDAQRLAAEAFGADHTWFLVNGCSVGIHASVMAVTRTGSDNRNGVLLVARNCHSSAFAAMVIAGCEPHWLQPEVDPRVGVAHCVTPETVRQALHEVVSVQDRTAVGVLIVSPTYFGAVADVEGIAAACHDFGVPLLVDEAHGGHFGFLHQPDHREGQAAAPSAAGPSATAAAPPALPNPALRCGADLVMQSTHKVLGAMTQAAMLHAQGALVSPSRISRALQTLQSSSPSYVLMASLDAARAQAMATGTYNAPMQAAQVIRQAVARCRHLQLLDQLHSPYQPLHHNYQHQHHLQGRTAHTATDADSPSGSAGPTAARPDAAPPLSSVVAFDPLRITLLVDRLPHSVLDAAAAAAATAAAHSQGHKGHAEATAAQSPEAEYVPSTQHDGNETAVPTGCSGFELAELLERCYGVVPELATAKTVVLALGPGTTVAHGEAAAAAFLAIDAAASDCCERVPPPSGTELPRLGQQQQPLSPTAHVALTPREAYFASTERVPIAQASGRVCAELLCPYPPGVPVAFPGERLSGAVLQLLRDTLAAGGTVTGAGDETLETIEVVVESGGM